MAPRFERDAPAAGPVVTGFAAGGFTVEGRTHAGLLLTPERAVGWQAPALAELSEAALEPILSLEPPPEFLILGTGAATAFPPAAFRRALQARGIGIEAMDSRAAARTWGLLRAEGRWIVAAILPL
jgi:uncharacterized protein